MDAMLKYFGDTMKADSQIRSLMAEKTSPYGVYYQFPRKTDLIAPLITIKIPGRTRPAQIRQDIIVSITAWGDFYDVQTEVYSLFHDTSPDIEDYRILSIKWIGASPELWDDKLQCYYREDKYQVIIAKD